jgi:spermidine synthase/MFS family permease
MATSTVAPAAIQPRAGTVRLAGVGAVVFLANAGLLALQLASGRLLAPFVGSSLETWTSIIGAFLAGIALGNAAGGRFADRRPHPRWLTVVLTLGGLAALWTIALPLLLDATGLHRLLPLGVRIPVLAAVLCFPPGFVLSLLTPMAIRLGLPDVRHAGRVAGLVFALATLGSLVGNYVTGFYLIPNLTVNGIVVATAGLLFAVAGVSVLGAGGKDVGSGRGHGREREQPSVPVPASPARLSLPRAYAIVAMASFAGMTLELTAARLLAQVLGVSLYTWTGVIGVMLAGTAAGNWLGGVLADRAGRSADPLAGRRQLAGWLALGAAAAVVALLAFHLGKQLATENLTAAEWLAGVGLVGRVLLWTFVLFFPPMLLLGTVSPQVIRLAVPDVAHAGRVAGRVYAWSTAGAIAGTFLTGFVLVSEFGAYRTVLLAALLPAAAAVLAGRVWERSAVLYPLSLVGGAAVAGFAFLTPQAIGITRETNYYTIQVADDYDPGVKVLILDHLIHSKVDIDDPLYLHYVHEQTQLELLQAAAAEHPGEQRVLVVGGGGYTFPRAARVAVPTSRMDVVEIDPGVTAVAYEYLALDPALQINSFHMDGRQFLAEKAAPGHYHLIVLDAVNDLAVPAHLLTREFNREVKKALAPNGVYLLTVIDHLEDGRLWRSAVRTLRETFAHVELVSPHDEYEPLDRQVYVIYAADRPLDLAEVRRVIRAERERRLGPSWPYGGVGGSAAAEAVFDSLYTHRLPPGEPERLQAKDAGLLLSDQFAPVDNLMAEVFRRR